MNKNTIIVVVVLLIAGIGTWYLTSSNMSEVVIPDNATTTGATVTPDKPAAGTGTFRSIFTQSGNHQCSYEQVTSSGRSSSVIYIADGKMRGEFRTTSGSVITATLMIYNGGTLYTWKEGATVGTKASIRTIADLPEAIPADLTSGAVLGTAANNVSWDCHDWAKDVKVFSIPTYVTFK
jgi:hypothetical protein